MVYLFLFVTCLDISIIPKEFSFDKPLRLVHSSAYYA